MRCLEWNLSKELLARYPVNAQRREDIKANASDSLAAMAGMDQEEESIFFEPEMAGNFGFGWSGGYG